MSQQQPSALTIGRRIRALRKGIGWSQTILATKVGTSQSCISETETGKARSHATYARIAEAIGVSVEFLIRPHDPETD